MKKRLLASLLSLCLLMGLLPTAALAAEDTADDTADEAAVVCAELEGCIDGAHDEDCPLYVAPGDGPSSDSEFEDVYGVDDDAVVISRIQARIDALPSVEKLEEMDRDEQAAVNREIGDLSDAIGELTDDEAAELDTAALKEAAAFFTSQIMTLGGGDDEEADALMYGDCGATDVDKVTWALTDDDNDGKYTLTISGSGAMADYESAPSESNTDTAQGWSKYYADITCVVVEDGITRIGDSALGGLLNVEEYSFGKDVFEIGSWGIKVNSTKRFVVNGNDAGLKVVDNVLLSKDGTILYGYPGGAEAVESYTTPAGVKEIREMAFAGCDAKKVIFSDGVEKITTGTFGRATTEELVIPDTVTDVGGANQTEKITLLAETIDPSTYASFSAMTELSLPNATAFPANFFDGKQTGKIKKVDMPNVLTIGEKGFYYCSALESVSMPKVQSIGKSAFENCSALKEIDFPESLNDIGEGAFRRSGLTKLVFPNSLTKIGKQAFASCTSLASVVYGTGIQTVEMNAFLGCTGIKVIDTSAITTFLSNDYWNGGLPYAYIFGNNNDGSPENFIAYLYQHSFASTLKNKYQNKAYYAVTGGGTFSADTNFTSGTLETPVKKGYIFDGWYTKDGTNNEWGSKVETPVAGNIYYAKWEGSSYNVTPSSIAFSSMTYGAISGNRTITVNGSGGSNPTRAESSDKNIFDVSVDGNTITVTPASTLAAGDYSETITVTAPDRATFSVPVTLTVTKAGSTVTHGGEDSSGNITATYGDTIPLTAKVQRAETGIATLTAAPDAVDFICGDKVLGSAEVQWNGGTGTATLTYDTIEGGIPVNQKAWITAEYGGNGNLSTGTGTNIISVTLYPKPLTITGLTATDREYNGNTTVALSGGTLSGKIDNDDVSAVMPTSGTMADADVGTGKAVTVPAITLSGADAGNYTLTPPPVTVNITKATYDMSMVTFANASYPYDGNEHTLTVSGRLPEGVTVFYNNNTLTDVGSTTARATFTGDETNYEAIADMTATLTITEAASKVTITPSATSLTGGGTVKLTVSGVPAGGTVTVTQTDDQGSEPKTLDLTENGEVSVNLSNTTAKYTFTVTYAGDANHAAASDFCTVDVVRKSNGGSGGGSSSSSYTVTVDSTKNGTVTVSPKNAGKGTAVTVTVKPNSGYELDDLTVTDKNGDTVRVKSQGSGKYTFTMPASKVTVEASFTKIMEQPKVSFVDVPTSAYYYDAVAWAVENGVTAGTSASTFSPNAACTRAQAVTFLWRAAGSPAPKNSVNPFADVPASAYYYDAVLWAVEQGITAGTSAATFSPDTTCTRGQIVTFLHRADGTAATGGNPFVDVADSAYYVDAVKWAVAESVTSGTSATTFSPNASCTRGQIVTFLYRAYA